jgi:hypothetical protein
LEIAADSTLIEGGLALISMGDADSNARKVKR